MKKSLCSIFTLLLALSILALFTACNEQPSPIVPETTTRPSATVNLSTILGAWEDELATKQRENPVTDEQFAAFSDEEREAYFEEFGTAPGSRLEFYADYTFAGNFSSDAIAGSFTWGQDGNYVLTPSEEYNAFEEMTATVTGDELRLSYGDTVLKRVQ